MIVERFDAISESRIGVSEDCAHLSYARGFIISESPVRRLAPHWRSKQLDGFSLSWDSRNTVGIAREGQLFVVFLGRGVHLSDWVTDVGDLAALLLEARKEGRKPYLDELEQLCGRYVVIDGGAGCAFLQSDAAGMRSAFFSIGRTPGIFASHSSLVAQALGGERSRYGAKNWMSDNGAYALPGRVTHYRNVVQLTPNTEVELYTRKVTRVFPRGPMEEAGSHAVAEQLLPLLQGQLLRLSEGGAPLIMSLSAGLDSRTSLALSRPMKDRIEYFTYDRRYGGGIGHEGLRQDVEVAQQLAQVHELRHRLVVVEGATLPPAVAEIMRQISPRAHGHPLAYQYRFQLPLDAIHIRSNLFEIGRSYYRGYRRKWPKMTPHLMRSLLTRGKSESPDILKAFELFFAATEFDRIYNYDPLDLYYWEHRMGTWLTSHIIESDIAHDTWTVINSRRIYSMLLSVPLAERLDASVYRHLIHMSWPELLATPINGNRYTAPVSA